MNLKSRLASPLRLKLPHVIMSFELSSSIDIVTLKSFT